MFRFKCWLGINDEKFFYVLSNSSILLHYGVRIDQHGIISSVDSFVQARLIKVSSQMDTVTKFEIAGLNCQKTESTFKEFCHQNMDVPKVKSVSCTITFFFSIFPQWPRQRRSRNNGQM